ncbi:MAG: hypothetical protein U1E42_03595 [Rhodospirillales bacterium]
MPTTPNLAITHVAASQAQKEVTLNDALNKLDRALTDAVAISVASGSAVVADADFRQNIALKVTGAAVAGRTVTVPAIKRLFVVISDTANAEDVTIARGATTVTLPAAATLICYTDGSTDGLIAASSAGAGGGGSVGPTTYLLSGSLQARPAAGQRVFHHLAGSGFALLTDLPGAVGKAKTAATAQADFDIRVNSVSKGTMRWPAAATSAAFIWTADVSVAAGDEIEIIAPVPIDATLADLSWTIEGEVGNTGEINLSDFWEAQLPIEPAAAVRDLIEAADAGAARAALGLAPAYAQALWGAYVNRVTNGDMRIDQRHGGGAVLVDHTTFYVLDRWQIAAQGTAGNGTITVQRVANAGGMAQTWTVTTQRTSPAAGDGFGALHWLEGISIADLLPGTAAALPFTVSFRIKASIPGTYVLSVGNGTADRCYPVAYTVDQADVEEVKAITIPGDTSGTWATDNGKGMYLRFDLGMGSDFESGSPGSWQAGNSGSAAGAVKLIRNAGATLQITDVQLVPGTTALPFQRRPIGEELALCQRYFEAGRGIWGGDVTMGAWYEVIVPYAVEKRAQPTIWFGDGNLSGFPAGNFNGGPVVPETRQFMCQKVANATLPGAFFEFLWTADAELW